jgi:hypothetical protein
MARLVKDAALATRNSRRDLKISSEPYWRALDKGLSIGYRRRATGGSWIARRYTEAGGYKKHKLGLADDYQDADGIKTMDFSQAQAAARDWSEREVRIEAGLEEKIDGAYTVKQAMSDYIAYQTRRGKIVKTTEYNIDAHILPVLGDIELAKLSTRKISDWQYKLASTPARLRKAKAATNQPTRTASEDPDVMRQRQSTANRILTTLKAALNHAWKDGKAASKDAWSKAKP